MKCSCSYFSAHSYLFVDLIILSSSTASFPGLLVHSVWSILKNMIGKDLTKITMPATINEPTSMLQRYRIVRAGGAHGSAWELYGAWRYWSVRAVVGDLDHAYSSFS